MLDQDKTQEQLIEELEDLRRRVGGQTLATDELKREIEERRRAEEALRASEEDLRTFFDTTVDYLFVVAKDGRILWANKTALTRLEAGEEEVIGQDILAIYPEERRKEAAEIVARSATVDTITCSVPLITKGGRLIPVDTRVVKGRWGGCDVYFGVCRDVSELKASEERFAKAFQSNPSPMAISSMDNRFLEVNQAFLRTLGYDRNEVVGCVVSELGSMPDPERQRTALLALQQQGHLSDFPVDVRTKDGRVRHGLFSAEIIQLQDERVVLTIMEDITERKQAQEAIERERQSLWHMLQASDHERQTISYEIHDDLAQYLAGAAMHLQSHDAFKATAPEKAGRAYKTAVELVHQAHFEARRLISRIRPPVIDEAGVETAIAHLVYEQRLHGGQEISFDSDVQFGRLPSILEDSLYRIAQEALINACKHSKSKTVTVSLVQEGQEVRFEVRDCGIGFDHDTAGKGRFGLEGIRQRVRLLGGRLIIQSTPGSGTLLQAIVPILEKRSEG